MDRLTLREQRQRWQRSRKPPFSLYQEGRSSDTHLPQTRIEKYLGATNGTHFTAEGSNNLIPVNGGALKDGETVLVWGDRLIGRSRGSEIF